MSLFGNTSNNAANPGLFGLNTSTQSNAGGFFGANQAKPEVKPFSFSTTQNPNPAQGPSIFGTSTQQQQQQQQQQQPNIPPTKPGLFTFGLSQQQNDANTQNGRPLDQTLRFGNPMINAQEATQSLWEEGRGLGVYRSIPSQMQIIKDRWDAANLQSPLRSYLYKHVGDEKEALRYRPNPQLEDESKWEEAVAKRPGPEWVPLLVRGFKEMGDKAKIQVEMIAKCNMLLNEINTSLDLQLETHDQKVAARLAECRRRQQAASKRTLALAVKVQILRNKGYVMDNAEEELKSKLEKLERDVLDPGLDAREQEIWARMLAIRERAKRLKAEMDKIKPDAEIDQPVLDDKTIKQAKEILEAYETQLQHLHKEMTLVQQEYEDWERFSNGKNAALSRGR